MDLSLGLNRFSNDIQYRDSILTLFFLLRLVLGLDRYSLSFVAFLLFLLVFVLLLLLDSHHPFPLNPLNFLPHSKKFDHLLRVNSGSDELRNRHVVLKLRQIQFFVPDLHWLVGLGFGLLVIAVGFCELGVDDCQCQVQKEEGPGKHNHGEVDDCDLGGDLLDLDLDVTPPFQGCGLEHHEQRIKHIVKVGCSIVRVAVALATVLIPTTIGIACAQTKSRHLPSCLWIVASVL